MKTAHLLAFALPLSLARAQGPTSYCTAGTSTNGCTPSIAANVQPNTTNTAGCVITVSGVEGQKQGIVFYGVDNTGFTPIPWGSGGSSFQCVKLPVVRLGSPTSSGGNAGACDGSYVIDWDAFQTANPASLGNPWVMGEKVFVQSWYRDPLAVKTSNLSNALELSVLKPTPVPCVTPLPGMVLIPAGSFQMGSNTPSGAPYFGSVREQPVRQVTISRCFWMGATEVTQAQYEAVMGPNSAPGSMGPNYPVAYLKWYEARDFCALFTAQEAALGNLPPGYRYRLPTEAEWEYACRAGTTTQFNVGDELLCSQARFSFSYHSNASCAPSNALAPVASYPPNAWGLYDMHGNAWEWVQDRYAPYTPGPVTDPFVSGNFLSERVLRGGASNRDSSYARSAHRRFDFPEYSFEVYGFRMVLAPEFAP